MPPVVHIRIGISGWRYADWRGDFYPDGLAQRRELEYASGHFSTIELNGSFYSLQSAASYGRWHEQTPDGFRFAVKGGRFITHFLRLKEPRQALANFFASGVLRLEEKLGPILWQLPPNMRYEPDRVRAFLDTLPTDTVAAVRLARGHGPQVAAADAWLETDRDRPIRHALEVRHESFLRPGLVEDLSERGVALAFSEAPDWPYVEELTTDFVYLRLHGARETYRSRYTDRELDRIAAKVRAWRDGEEPREAVRITGSGRPRRLRRDVWIYFDNTDKRHAPRDAGRLMRLLDNGTAVRAGSGPATASEPS